MKLCLVSDLHGYRPRFEESDVLVIAGDLTARDREIEYQEFAIWLSILPFKRIIIVPGNHDVFLSDLHNAREVYKDFIVLIDDSYEHNGVKFYGSPWTKRFHGQNINCMAYTMRTEAELAETFLSIPKDTDILITHSPPFGILDNCDYGRKGSISLMKTVELINPSLHVFGHIHEGAGVKKHKDTTFLNAAQLNEMYDIAHSPYYFEFDPLKKKLTRIYAKEEL
jgi:Icc-related predicted phosphoesterase